MHPLYRTGVLLLSREHFYIFNQQIYFIIYFFETCCTISIYPSTKCRVFHNVTFFWFVTRFCKEIYIQPPLTFRHHASSKQDRRSATLQRTLFIYLINKYISLYIFLRLAVQSQFIPPQNVVYFITLPFLV